MRVRWEDLDSQIYEDMGSVLLSRLHPDAQRIDGSGGDGGRDVQIVHGRDKAILEAFELKSFTGRMDSGRRQQVSNSLKRATALTPVSWTLVVPIDPTPGELEWFKNLGSNYCFPIKWNGKTWLDEKMSAFPDIRRYFLEGAKDEVFELLREIKKEKARITEVHDAVGRLRNLRERLNEIDPYYRYELSTGQFMAGNCPPGVVFSAGFGDVRVDIYPRYAGAIEDRPITAKLEFDIELGDVAVRDALDYGLEATIPSRMIRSMEIDAPSGLGGSFTEGEVKILPASSSLDEPIIFALDIMDGDRLIVSCPLYLMERTVGLRGAMLAGTDSTGWLQVSLKFDIATRKGEAKIRLDPKPAMPAALAPLFRWLGELQPPRYLVIRTSEGSVIRSDIRQPLMNDVSLVRVVEDLAYIQEASGVYWNMPLSLSREEESEIVRVARLLRGERISFTWEPFTLGFEQWGSSLREVLGGLPRQFRVEQDFGLELDGVTIPIGRIRTHLDSAYIANPGEIQKAISSGVEPHLRLVPGDSDKGYRELVPEPE